MHFSKLGDLWVLLVLCVLNADSHSTACVYSYPPPSRQFSRPWEIVKREEMGAKEPKAHMQGAAGLGPLGPRKRVTTCHGPLKIKVTHHQSGKKCHLGDQR